MTKLNTIDLATLSSVTGGAFSPCVRFSNLPVSQASGMDLAIAHQFCGLALPTAEEKRRAKDIRFEVPLNGR